LGGSMLTKEVNVCACRQSCCSKAEDSRTISGNTAAYQSCLGEGWLRVCGATVRRSPDMGAGDATGMDAGEASGRHTGERFSAGRYSAANKSAVRDFAERNFTGHQDLPGRADRLAL
jgi:hypothetical protein